MNPQKMLVSSKKDLLSLLGDLSGLPIDPPSLYLDIEGVKLGRFGSISIIALRVPPLVKTYLIDVHVLGHSTFNVKDIHGSSLRGVLEDSQVPKVFFDIRNDSDALYSHFGICVNGIVDLQLLELATRDYSLEYLAGLSKCLWKDAPVKDSVKNDWQLAKDTGRRLFEPQRGGRFEIFNDRPIGGELKRYCAQDVLLLPPLYEAYRCKLRGPYNAFWRSMVKKQTEARILISQSVHYDPHSESKVCGPWDRWNIEDAREDWNNDVVVFGANCGMILDENDRWTNHAVRENAYDSVFTLMAEV